MAFTIRDANPQPLAVTRRPRPNGPRDIQQICWHATRGNVAMDRQVAATENWFAHPSNDLGGWGGSADFVVGPDFRANGEIVIVQFGKWWETFSSWSAGYGGAGTLPAAQYQIAIEVAQPAWEEPFTDQTIEACIWLVKDWILPQFDVLGIEQIPPVRIPFWDQSPDVLIPRGHIGHEDLANGKKLGKTDPGRLFPWERILSALTPVPPAPLPVPSDPFEDGRKEGYRQGWADAHARISEAVAQLKEPV